MWKGIFLLLDLDGRLLAVSLTAGLNSAAGILQAIALVICFGGLIGAIIQAFSERSASGLMLIRLFQQTPRGSVIGWLARRFPKPCANFSRSSPPKRLVESTWPPAAGRMVLCVLDAGTGVLMNW